MYLESLRTHVPVVILSVVALALIVTVGDYFLVKKRIQLLSPYYQRVAEKYCPMNITEKRKQGNCLNSIESAALYNYRFVAPFSAKQIPAIAKCGTSVIMTVGPDYGEMFDWCDDNESDRAHVITFINFDIIADSLEKKEKYLAVLTALSQQYKEPIESAAFLVESESEETVIGKAFFGDQYQKSNIPFNAHRTKDAVWMLP